MAGLLVIPVCERTLIHKTGNDAKPHIFFRHAMPAKNDRLQLIDLKRLYFCLGFGQFIETRIVAGFAPCQEGLVNKVTHSSCG